MRILIIGGTGLISTAIAHLLAERGLDDVVLYNRGRSEYPTAPGVTVVSGDRTDYPRFERQMRDLGHFDCVLDMVGYEPGDGESVVRAYRGRIGQLIFCSTVDVYQKPAGRYPCLEDEPYGGLNDYSRKKVAIERTLWAAAGSDFPLTVIRPAYTYGEGRGPVHIFPGTSYLDRLRKGKPIVVPGDGATIWVACHRDDVARAFVNAVGKEHAFNQAYHATGEDNMTWLQYHRRAAAAIGAPEPTLVPISSGLLAQATGGRVSICQENFGFNNIFDTSKAHCDLDFRYTVQWEDGVRRMARWLDERGRVADSDEDDYEDRVIAAWRRAGVPMAVELAAASRR